MPPPASLMILARLRILLVLLTAIAGDAAFAQQPKRWRFIHANELQTPFTTIRIGAAILPEIAGYQQDAESRQQLSGAPVDSGAGPDIVDLRGPGEASALRALPGPLAASLTTPGELPTAGKIRDSRFIIKGRLMTRRQITWQTGLMYDWLTEKWFVRQTGFVVSVPEIASNFWIGRTKEGPSMNRVMVGYDGWSMERFTFSDAAIPLLADGIRWQGYLAHSGFFWNLGYFLDFLSEGESFSYFDNQVAGRLGYARVDSTDNRVLHIGFGFHNGIPNKATLHLKSKPEASGAPNFVDTGKFPATVAQLGGIEAYYQTGAWLFGTEYYVERARSPQTGNPVFHGGDVVALWLMTPGSRGYVTPGNYFRAVHPTKAVFEGGVGTWELMLRLSNIDLDAGTLTGGKFWRVTPGLNWHLSDEARLELGYGYGVLDRFGLRGTTHFFQSRLQLQL